VTERTRLGLKALYDVVLFFWFDGSRSIKSVGRSGIPSSIGRLRHEDRLGVVHVEVVEGREREKGTAGGGRSCAHYPLSHASTRVGGVCG
jgi:hypothetical protein